MKLFVDYTNWKGVRAWREIEHPSAIELGKYNEENGDTIITMIMHVSMVDRSGHRRTLRVDHIHGFRTES